MDNKEFYSILGKYGFTPIVVNGARKRFYVSGPFLIRYFITEFEDKYQIFKESFSFQEEGEVEILIYSGLKKDINSLNSFLKSLPLYTKVFYDCEFMEGVQKGSNIPTIDLISIAFIDENEKELYLISNEFNLEEAWTRDDLWIRNNVLRPIYDRFTTGKEEFTLEGMREVIQNVGVSRQEIKEAILKYMPDKPEFWGYYGAYDHVCLAWIFGRMIDLPRNFPMFTKDIRQLIDDRLFYASPNELHIPREGTIHDALEDARHQRKLFYHVYKYY